MWCSPTGFKGAGEVLGVHATGDELWARWGLDAVDLETLVEVLRGVGG